MLRKERLGLKGYSPSKMKNILKFYENGQMFSLIFENSTLFSRTKRPPNNMHKLMCKQKSSINSRTSQRRTPRKAGRTQAYWKNVALGSWSNHQLIMNQCKSDVERLLNFGFSE